MVVVVKQLNIHGNIGGNRKIREVESRRKMISRGTKQEI